MAIKAESSLPLCTFEISHNKNWKYKKLAANVNILTISGFEGQK
jgi:hypothetical protein